MNKLWIVLGVVVVLILAFIAGLSFFETRKEQAEALKDTDISLSGIEVNGISSEAIDLNITLDIYNPNDVTARLERMDYNVYANDVRVGSGSFEESVEIPSNEGRRTSTNFVAQLSSVPSAILNALVIGEVLWSVEGVVYFGTPLGTIEQSFAV